MLNFEGKELAIVKKKSFQLLVFWSVAFLVNLGPNWQRYGSAKEAFEVAALATILQLIVAVIAINVFVPHFLNKDKLKSFAVWLVVLVFIAAEIYILVSFLYLEPTYPNTYGDFYNTKLGHLSLVERLGFSGMIKYIILSKIPMLFFPTAILIAANFYQSQKKLLEIREQKQAAELSALKSQLNPHFIFNTLNNIYSLALKKSDRAPEAIAKLSGIFDYVLYRCNEKFVYLSDEIEMIENFIALEKLRFSNRINVTLDNQVQHESKVAPLLYLSLVENAFKHGVANELGEAKINLRFTEDQQNITFQIENSKPKVATPSELKPSIGLQNLKRQLELLYPAGTHSLEVYEDEGSYIAKLKLDKVS